MPITRHMATLIIPHRPILKLQAQLPLRSSPPHLDAHEAVLTGQHRPQPWSPYLEHAVSFPTSLCPCPGRRGTQQSEQKYLLLILGQFGAILTILRRWARDSSSSIISLLV